MADYVLLWLFLFYFLAGRVSYRIKIPLKDFAFEIDERTRSPLKRSSTSGGRT